MDSIKFKLEIFLIWVYAAFVIFQGNTVYIFLTKSNKNIKKHYAVQRKSEINLKKCQIYTFKQKLIEHCKVQQNNYS